MMALTPEIPLARLPDLTGASMSSTDTNTADPFDGASIDVPQLLENCLGMPPFAVSLLDEFARTAASRAEAFAERFKAADLPAVAELAHALKGVAGIIAAQRLREYAIELEMACERQDLLLTAQLVHTVRSGIQRIQQDIPEISQSVMAGNG